MSWRNDTSSSGNYCVVINNLDESVTDYLSRHDEKITIYQHVLEPFDMWNEDEC